MSGRRDFMRRSSAAALGAAALLATSRAAGEATGASQRLLSLANTHTGERIALVYAAGVDYLPDALQRLNRFLRDHYSGEVGRMDPLLFDQLHRLRQQLGLAPDTAFEVISGYRCEATNSRLRKAGGGGVATRSLHLQGRAIDVRLPGVPLAALRDAALALGAGGVGYYPAQQFVHLDTGAVRRW